MAETGLEPPAKRRKVGFAAAPEVREFEPERAGDGELGAGVGPDVPDEDLPVSSSSPSAGPANGRANGRAGFTGLDNYAARVRQRWMREVDEETGERVVRREVDAITGETVVAGVLGEQALDLDGYDDSERGHIEAFNLDDEREDGHFDDAGNYVRRRTGGAAADAWADALDDPDVLAKSIHRPQPRRAAAPARPAASSADDVLRAKAAVIAALQPRETVGKALARLRPVRGADRSAFDRLVEAADALVQSGACASVYRLNREALVDTTTQWYYQWKPDDAEFGPFTAAEMVQWLAHFAEIPTTRVRCIVPDGLPVDEPARTAAAVPDPSPLDAALIRRLRAIALVL